MFKISLLFSISYLINTMSYNQFASEFSASRQNLWPELLEFKKYLKDGIKVLDLGCGNGRLVSLLKDYKIDYVGSDISESLLNYAKKQEKGKINEFRFVESDMMKLDFPKESFDIIFMIASFHHLENKKQRLELLQNMNFWLKKDGILVMTNWNLWEKHNFKKYFKCLFDFSMSKTFRDFIIPFKNNRGESLGKRFYHSFTKSEIEKLIKKTGFNIIDNKYSDKKKNLITIVHKA